MEPCIFLSLFTQSAGLQEIPLQNRLLTWYNNREFVSCTFIYRFLIPDRILSKFEFLAVGWNKLPPKMFLFTYQLEKRNGVLLHSKFANAWLKHHSSVPMLKHWWSKNSMVDWMGHGFMQKLKCLK